MRAIWITTAVCADSTRYRDLQLRHICIAAQGYLADSSFSCPSTNWQMCRMAFNVPIVQKSWSPRLIGLLPDRAFAKCMSVKTTQQNVHSRPMSKVIKPLTGRRWLVVKASLGTNLRAPSIHDRQVLLVVVQQIHSLSSHPKATPALLELRGRRLRPHGHPHPLLLTTFFSSSPITSLQANAALL